MPKESVHVRNPQNGGDDDVTYDEVEVSWSKGPSGSVVAVATRGRLRNMIEGAVEEPVYMKHVDPDMNDGFYISLDRDGLERHIKQCQKAGRDVFGRSAW